MAAAQVERAPGPGEPIEAGVDGAGRRLAAVHVEGGEHDAHPPRVAGRAGLVVAAQAG